MSEKRDFEAEFKEWQEKWYGSHSQKTDFEVAQWAREYTRLENAEEVNRLIEEFTAQAFLNRQELHQAQARIKKLEEALLKIEDVTSAFKEPGRKVSYADFELRLIARLALKGKYAP